MTGDPYLTTRELAGRWRTTARAVRSEIGRGRLPATFIGGQWLVTAADAEAFERARRTGPEPTKKRTRRPRARGKAVA